MSAVAVLVAEVWSLRAVESASTNAVVIQDSANAAWKLAAKRDEEAHAAREHAAQPEEEELTAWSDALCTNTLNVSDMNQTSLNLARTYQSVVHQHNTQLQHGWLTWVEHRAEDISERSCFLQEVISDLTVHVEGERAMSQFLADSYMQKVICISPKPLTPPPLTFVLEGRAPEFEKSWPLVQLMIRARWYMYPRSSMLEDLTKELASEIQAAWADTLCQHNSWSLFEDDEMLDFLRQAGSALDTIFLNADDIVSFDLHDGMVEESIARAEQTMNEARAEFQRRCR